MNSTDHIKTLNSILVSQARALHHMSVQYKTSEFAIKQLAESLRLLENSLLNNGKIVISGIGKSHKIAAKTVATLNSLSLPAALLHPTEALHGDLGILHPKDSLILVSASGGSPELLTMLEHTNVSSVILLTCTRTSPLGNHPKVAALLLADLPKSLSEESIYGLKAPTISTTVSLALADAVAISLMEMYVKDLATRRKLFGERHPGGSIGQDFALKIRDSSFLSLDSVTAVGSSDEESDMAETPLVIGKVARGLPENELDLLRQCAKYEWLEEGNKRISTTVVRDMYKDIVTDDCDEETFSELMWRIRNAMSL